MDEILNKIGDVVKDKVISFQDNAKNDELRSMLRSVKDFLGNYPRYYIEGLVGTISDMIKK